ncbi:MAG TPA: response regulator transcription factor [Solirubrobacteraceae bacterium]|nr:response regulator transcription factor [Solirubrobacteraceae bacterium]
MAAARKVRLNDAQAIFASLGALLAPERWHDGAPGPEPAAFQALSVAELGRVDGHPDPDAWDAAAQHFAALKEPFELGYARWRQGEALIVAGGDRELTVLGLVAEGHTNREIGETLFISEKTASVHVSRILAKLGVRARVEAATAAHRLGLAASSAPGDGGGG